MAKKKPKSRLRVPEEVEDLEEAVDERLKKGKTFARRQRRMLEAEKDELMEELDEDIRKGKRLIGKEKVKLEENVRERPLEYIAGAFVLGFIIGKISK